jgi:hypothetical protein
MRWTLPFAPLSERPFTVGGCTYGYTRADLDALSGPVDRVPEDLIPQLADLLLGFYDELHATPELLPWLLSLRGNRIDAARILAVESIAHGQSGPRH